MFSSTSRKNILIKYDLDLVSFVAIPAISWMSSLKKTGMERDILIYYIYRKMVLEEE